MGLGSARIYLEVIFIQTFLPYPNFIGSAKVLDMDRLRHQRVENLQIMQMLLGKQLTNVYHLEHTGEYRTAYFDREGEEIPLSDLDPFDYWSQEVVPVMALRASLKRDWGIRDLELTAQATHPAVTMWRGSEHALMAYQNAVCDEWMSRTYKDTCKEKTQFLLDSCDTGLSLGFPEWLGDEDFHRSHQSNLVRKHPVYYRQFFPDVPDDLPYIWPSGVGSRQKQGV